MYLAHKIELKPNNKQKTYFAKAAGVARFAYNWGLAEWGKQYEEWKKDNSLPKPNGFSLDKKLNAIKKTEFPWMKKVTKWASQSAILQLDIAFKNFFAGKAKYPKFKKKGRNDRFTVQAGAFKIKDNHIYIARLGWVRMRQKLRFNGKLISATISRVADKWYVSVVVDVANLDHLPPAENQGVVGVDLGVSTLATLSTGEVVDGPKPHRALLRRLRRLSRSLSRKKVGSAKREKAKIKLAKLHARIANVRKDALHKLTSELTRRFHTIVVEDLNVKGMVKNRHLSRSIMDMGFSELRRQLGYKAAMRGGQVIVADRFYPSSKTCSSCGYKLDKLPLSTRTWTCPACGEKHDRDCNAAKNLLNYGLTILNGSTVEPTGSEARGDGSAGFEILSQSETTSMKREVSGKSSFKTRFA